jgi:tryptophanyl-tRNA synthetase
VNATLAPLRERRREVQARPDSVKVVLADGSRRARAQAQITMDRVRDAVRLRY